MIGQTVSVAQKPLMQIGGNLIADFAASNETGMDFYIAATQNGFAVVLENFDVLPLYPDQNYYCLDDLLTGHPIPPMKALNQQFGFHTSFPNRAQAIAALLQAKISPSYVGAAGAIPLIATHILPANTKFLRYISSSPDHRYNSSTKSLTAGTYLTSKLDGTYANTGFCSVGRYALPLPIPVIEVVEYTLLAGTTIEVGTVAPQFGQAGGGVEIRLPINTKVITGAKTSLPAY